MVKHEMLVIPNLIWDPKNKRQNMKKYWVYIVASRYKGTIYIGVTNDIYRRIYEHKNGLIAGFTKKYGVDKLVYTEEYTSIEDAIIREKQLKPWKRQWKIDLIESVNPQWNDIVLGY